MRCLDLNKITEILRLKEMSIFFINYICRLAGYHKCTLVFLEKIIENEMKLALTT